MRIAIGTDHHWYEMGQEIIKILEKHNHSYMYAWAKNSQDIVALEQVVDYTTMDVLDEKTLWILICGTGIWVNIWANKKKWIRASLCNNFNQVRWGRQKDDMNIMCLAAREEEFLDLENLVKTFINTKFDNEKIIPTLEKMDSWR